MSRSDRQYTGGPHYPLDDVRICISLRQFTLTRKAETEDGPRVLPAGTVRVFDAVKAIVLDLQEADWKFSQEKNGKWVDVYRSKFEGGDYWVKVKIELSPNTKAFAVVVSFHEWDDYRPI